MKHNVPYIVALAVTLPLAGAKAPAQTLAEALDATNLVWTTGGDDDWFGQTDTTLDGVDAAQSGAITHSQSTWLEASVTGPVVLTFWWKVSSEANRDWLEVYVDGVRQGRISGEVGWQSHALFIPAGTHTCRWRYVKDGRRSIGEDAGWVDQVQLSAGVPLAEALEATNLVWTTGGDANWFGQNANTRDGVDAAQSGAITDEGTSWLEAAVTGPVVLTFWWKVSSQQHCDWLEFYVDGILRARISGEVDWQSHALFIPEGTHTCRWQYVKDGWGTDGRDAGWVDRVQLSAVVPLAEALEATNLVWSTGGDANWFGQTAVAHDGVDAAQSGAITEDGTSWMEATVTGPGLLTFWWKVSSEERGDWLEVYVDGVRQGRISGEVDWQLHALPIPEGPHTCRWQYVKDGWRTEGLDAGWVDQVQLSAVVPLAEALDTINLVWTTGGDANWFGQTNTTDDGVDAAQSGAITDNGTSWMEATVTGPVVLTFWWKVSSQKNYDWLEVYVDGVLRARISGEVGWELCNLLIPDGTHTCRWQYVKDDWWTDGLDAGWVDRVQLSAHVELAEALDTTNLFWNTGGDADWFAQNANTHDGVDAAQSGPIDHRRSTWLEALVTGPVVLTFWWKVSSQQDCDWLEFYVDGVRQGRISGEVDWQLRGLFIPEGTHTCRWQYVKDRSGTDGLDTGWVDRVQLRPFRATPLAEALDATNLVWTTGGDADWFGQTAMTRDGVDAAQSGAITDNGTSWLEATVTGPGVLTFWWQVSSEANRDWLEVYVDGVRQARISGEVDWQLRALPIPEGPRTCRWQYVKNDHHTAGWDAGWVDQVQFSAVVPLAEALDTTNLVWTTGGDAYWFGQTNTTHDGVDAAQSGAIADSRTNWLEATVTGPVVLTFWWKVSSQRLGDALEVYVGGVLRACISGEVDWQSRALFILEGTHTCRWQYVKDGLWTAGWDAGWVDRVQLRPFRATPLPEALDATNLVWTTGGDANWFGQTNTTHDGVDAAQSGAIAHSRTNWLEATVTGPGLLTFWWKVSSEANRDWLEVYVDGVRQGRISGEVDWQLRGLFIPEGTHTCRWQYVKDAWWTEGQDAGWVDRVQLSAGVPLAEALDAANLVWTTGGDANWFGQTNTTHDGVDAAQSGAIGDRRTNWLEATVTGPGVLTFWWKVSSQQHGDWLEVYVDGVRQARISGEVDWQLRPVPIPAGPHTCRWQYVKDGWGTAGWDAGWVDQVQLSPVVPLAEALDAANLVWTTGGDATWFGQNANTRDGVDAAQSGAIADSRTNWLEATVTGPGVLTFWWKVSSQPNRDWLEVYVDGVLRARISGEADWQLRALFIPEGTHTCRWQYVKDGWGTAGWDAGWVDQVQLSPVVPLAEALDAANLVWTTGGDANWFGQTAVAHDGVDAAQSGAITDNGTSWMEATVTGPVVLTFWWKVSSEEDCDWLEVYVDGVRQGRISGEVDWQSHALFIPEGTHTCRWRYLKDGSVSEGRDAGWVDQVHLRPFRTMPLAEALDAANLVWTTRGDANWFGQNVHTHDGVDAAQSGAIAHSRSTWLEASVTGPGVLTFWWKVSSEEDYDWLEFYVDGVRQVRISGQVDWQLRTFLIPEGPHTCRWRYVKDGSGSEGLDAGWVDRVQLSVVAPRLTIARTATNSVIISWPVSVDMWQLQACTDLGVGDWVNVPIPPLRVDGQMQVVIYPILGVRYYRLVKVTTASLPTLSIALTATNTVVVSWPLAGATGWVLQATNALPSVAAPWPVIPPPYQTSGPNLQYIELAPVGHKFYRLHKP